MTKLGDVYKLEVDEDGKVRVQRDEAKIKAKKPVNQRFASKKTRYAKPGEINSR